jgi:5-methyltetrahydropteroyltriglutamate--homocysteine methyltransferase
MPGVVARCSHFTERPGLIAERLVTYGRLVGRQNITAGTDCGLGTRAGHGASAVAKSRALAGGAQQASQGLWREARALGRSHAVEKRGGSAAERI